MIRRPPRSTLFPYPPLSRSHAAITAKSATTPQANHGLENCWPQVNLCRSRMKTARPAKTLTMPRPKTLASRIRSEEHTSELQSQSNLVCRLLLEKKKQPQSRPRYGLKNIHSSKPAALASTAQLANRLLQSLPLQLALLPARSPCVVCTVYLSNVY